MANLLDQMIEQISREKHIEPEIIVAAIEDAMVVAARKYYKTEENLRAKFNPETGQIDVYSVRAVVDEVADPKNEMTLSDARKVDPQLEVGGELLIPKPTGVLGRIAAQTAKQVIMQKVREAERDTIFNEYNGRAGELVNCIVKRFEGPDVIVDMGRTEARLPKRGLSSRPWTEPQKARKSLSPELIPYWCSACSKWRSRRSTTARCKFGPRRAKRVSAPKSPYSAAIKTSIQWAPAWA